MAEVRSDDGLTLISNTVSDLRAAYAAHGIVAISTFEAALVARAQALQAELEAEYIARRTLLPTLRKFTKVVRNLELCIAVRNEKGV